MTLDQLLADLADKQIVLFMDGERLRYRAPAGSLTDDLRATINKNRTAIIKRLIENVQLAPSLPAKCITCDRKHWTDKPPKNGRIQTVCGKCGRFIGYRPANI
jgi:hypothetical protein